MINPRFTPVSPYPQPGEVLDGKYLVERLIGEGGMGAVAKATHMLRRAPVALKFMSPAVLALKGAVERFVNEGVAASQIDSDHVVKVFDVGLMPSGAPYLVMEYLEGCDLAQLLTQAGGQLDVTRTVHFALQILRALQTAHASGIIHRDMKPSNCFVINKDGEADFVKLVDFGISKVRSDDGTGHQANLTQTNTALGTPLYMSPEQARSPRDVDTRADLYSVGAIMYELLTGRTPHTADSGEYTEILFKIFTTDPDPIQSLRPDLPAGLAAAVQRALARDRNARFSSASEMAEALVPYADGRSANVVARLRGGRGFSLVPSTAPAPLAAAVAVTPPRPATDTGVSREAAGTGAPGPGRGGTIAVVALLAGMLLLGGTTAVLVMRRSPPHTPDHARLEATTGAPGVPSATVVARATVDPTALPATSDPTAASPSAQLAPLASTSPSPSAIPSAVASATSAAASASSKPHAPSGGSLVGVQPHF